VTTTMKLANSHGGAHAMNIHNEGSATAAVASRVRSMGVRRDQLVARRSAASRSIWADVLPKRRSRSS
jgi:hypothetical protein